MTDWPIERIPPSNCQVWPQHWAHTYSPVSPSNQSEKPFVSVSFSYTWKAAGSKNGTTGHILKYHRSGKVLKYNNLIEEQEEPLRKTIRKHRGAAGWGFRRALSVPETGLPPHLLRRKRLDLNSTQSMRWMLSRCSEIFFSWLRSSMAWKKLGGRGSLQWQAVSNFLSAPCCIIPRNAPFFELP